MTKPRITITINTHLNAGIYLSEGGGENRVHYSWAAGPRNLLDAAKLMPEHRQSMVSGYGNIGCGRSWLQIGDQRIAGDFDFPENLAEARSLLARVASGQYAADQRAIAVAMDQSLAEESLCWDQQCAQEMADKDIAYREDQAGR